jgi:demethylmenaquinone methyltransferase/2-methoxy-6-polyprenyl-1,4-benzoquinol methylase
VSQDAQRVETTYRRIGRRWVYNALLFASFQGWEPIIRRRAVARLELEPGDSVLDVSCGHCGNFGYLVRAVGPDGRIVGVDFSATMLEGVERVIQREAWKNIELVKLDAAKMTFEKEFDGALETLALTVIPDWRGALERMVAATRAGGRVVTFDGRYGTGLRSVWNPYYRMLSRIVAADLTRDIPAECRTLLTDVRDEAIFVSNAYIVSGNVSS